MWKGRVELTTPMLFCVGFLLIFLLGGITGVMVAVLPFDWQVTDSYFVVAHFHYVLNGAVVFPIFGAIYFWIPKMTGRMLSERWGKISFWTMFIGFNVAFFPMHILGFLGMPRRVWTYADGLGWTTLNKISSVGSFAFAVGTGITLVNWFVSHRRGAPAADNPWGGDSLEWSTTSPPPEYNFESIPVVAGRHPLWDADTVPTATGSGNAGAEALDRQGALDRATPVTSGIDTRPEERLDIPEPTYVPFMVALGIAVFFLGLLVSAATVGVIGVAVGAIAIVVWAWRTDIDLR